MPAWSRARPDGRSRRRHDGGLTVGGLIPGLQTSVILRSPRLTEGRHREASRLVRGGGRNEGPAAAGTHMWTAPGLQELSGRASDRLRSYVRSVVAATHDRCQAGFRDASSKQSRGLGCHWVPRSVSRLGIDRSHQLLRLEQASGLAGGGDRSSCRRRGHVSLGAAPPIMIEAIPSEPPSLARPPRRAAVAEGGWRPSPWWTRAAPRSARAAAARLWS